MTFTLLDAKQDYVEGYGSVPLFLVLAQSVGDLIKKQRRVVNLVASGYDTFNDNLEAHRPLPVQSPEHLSRTTAIASAE